MFNLQHNAFLKREAVFAGFFLPDVEDIFKLFQK